MPPLVFSEINRNFFKVKEKLKDVKVDTAVPFVSRNCHLIHRINLVGTILQDCCSCNLILR